MPTTKKKTATKVATKTAKKTYVPKPRKATFTMTKEKGERIFTPVNKRAQKWAKKVGKRTRCTVKDLTQIKATGKVKLYQYDKGALKPIKV